MTVRERMREAADEALREGRRWHKRHEDYLVDVVSRIVEIAADEVEKAIRPHNIPGVYVETVGGNVATKPSATKNEVVVGSGGEIHEIKSVEDFDRLCGVGYMPGMRRAVKLQLAINGGRKLFIALAPKTDGGKP